MCLCVLHARRCVYAMCVYLCVTCMKMCVCYVREDVCVMCVHACNREAETRPCVPGMLSLLDIGMVVQTLRQSLFSHSMTDQACRAC